MLVQDLCTIWMHSHQTETKAAVDTKMSILRIPKPRNKLDRAFLPRTQRRSVRYGTVVQPKGGQESENQKCKRRAPRPVRHWRRWTRHKSHSKQAHIYIDLRDGTRTGGEPPAIRRTPPTRLGPPEKTEGTAHGDTPQVTSSLLTDAHLLVSKKQFCPTAFSPICDSVGVGLLLFV